MVVTAPQGTAVGAAARPEGLTVDGHEVVEGPGRPVLADRGDALGKQAEDGLEGPAGRDGVSRAIAGQRAGDPGKGLCGPPWGHCCWELRGAAGCSLGLEI